MTSIPLHRFRCGYFDAGDVIEFTPQLEELQRMTPALSDDRISSGIKSPHPAMSTSTVVTWHLFTVNKRSAREIAELRQLSLLTIYRHLEEAIRCGVLSVTELVSAEQVETVASLWTQWTDHHRTPMKSLSQKLNEEIPHGVLRCVVAAVGRLARYHQS